MRNLRTPRSASLHVCWTLTLLLAGCASTGVHPPERWLKAPRETVREPYGGWVEVKTTAALLTGELIAVTADTLFIANPFLIAVPASHVLGARLLTYDADNLAGAVIGGTISTLLNGWLLIFTAPMWIIGGTIAAATRPYEALIEHPGVPLQDFAAFARHPAGLPPGLDRNAVTRKPSHTIR